VSVRIPSASGSRRPLDGGDHRCFLPSEAHDDVLLRVAVWPLRNCFAVAELLWTVSSELIRGPAYRTRARRNGMLNTPETVETT
jgi:hypothetical protein